MPAMPQQRPRLHILAAAALLAALAGCTSVDNYSRSLVNAITPYKVEVVQGNFVSREQVEALQKGMNREQVRNILGTPLVTSLFHADRWDYVFSLRRQWVEPQQRRLTVYFKDDMMERAEGDTMPSEAEFVSTLQVKNRPGKVPRLEATEEELRAFPKSSTPAAQPEPAPPATTNYPPLESAPR